MKTIDIIKKFPPDKSKMLLILEALQEDSKQHYITSEDIKEVADYLNTSLSSVYGVAKYYSMLSLHPKGKYVIRICASPVCNSQQSCSIRKEISGFLSLNNGEVTKDGVFSLETVECLGHCDKASVMMINNEVYGNLSKEKTIEIIKYIKSKDKLPESSLKSNERNSEEKRLILKNIGNIDPYSLQDYENVTGMKAFEKALNIKTEFLIKEIIDSGLRGRGGAGFPTGLKWKFTSENKADQKYAICNADEGEPGTFKDRPIMEELPFQYIEGLMIAAYSINATKAYIYIRGEYAKSIEMTENALAELYKYGWLGKRIKGSGYDLDIEIFIGAGSYLCGDELTLIESLEGKRGNPRFKPPFPAEKGLFGKPTLVNNVETLAIIPYIVNNGASEFRKYGTEKSSGTKIFPISGDVLKPGFYEAELGISLSTLINHFAGGIKDGKKLGAVLIGGATGTFVSLDDVESLKMDYDSLIAKNYVLGSGAIMVFDEEKPMFDILYSIIKFFKHESCGKCVPCRVGCVQLLKLMKILKDTKDLKEKTHLFEKMFKEAKFMADTSLCALGQSPVLALRSAYEYYLTKF